VRREVGAARAVARETGGRLFLAGGAVRDLLLGRPVRDVDLVVEGDASRFARGLAERLRVPLRRHERFDTATLSLPGGRSLDVAATRRERYGRSGALPETAPGAPIAEDLERRDFTINALALELGRTPRLLDPLEGRKDLRRGLVRVLHARSFLDDPTRILRAVRYAARLGFRLAPSTRRWLVEAVEDGALDRISADRLRREVRLILEEPERGRAVLLMGRLGVDSAIHPTLRRPDAVARLGRVGPDAGWLCYLLAWMGEVSAAEAQSVAARLGLSRKDRRAIVAEGVPTGAVPGVRGADLIAAGVPQGPAIGRALARTREAVRDGRIEPAGALAFALLIARARGEKP